MDFVARAVDKARAKAEANKVAVNFVRADVTRLSSGGIGSTFGLIVDNGCLHGMSPDDRDAYVREVAAVAAPGRSAAADRIRPRRDLRRAWHRSG